MTNKNKKGLSLKNVAFYGAVAIALIVIGYFFLNPKHGGDKNSIHAINSPTSESSKVDSSVQNNKNTAALEPTPRKNAATVTTQEPQPDKGASSQESSKGTDPTSQNKGAQGGQPVSNSSQESTQTKPTGVNNAETVKPTAKPEVTPNPSSKAEPTAKPIDAAIKILKNEVTSQAKFYPYKMDKVNMEVIAVKASDGTIRTALNTCQVCYDSGRGYYVQVGEYLVCQNCKNKFHIDQVEKVKGGCNPVPILEENKTVLEDSIVISKDFMAGQKEFFSNWKTR